MIPSNPPDEDCLANGPIESEWEAILDDFLDLRWRLSESKRQKLIEKIRDFQPPKTAFQLFTGIKINHEFWILKQSSTVKTIRVFQMEEDSDISLIPIKF